MQLTEFQSDVLGIITEHSSRFLFGKATCTLKNKEIMSRMQIKPTNEMYISRIIKILEEKKFLKSEMKQLQGGRKRLITIL